MLGDVVRFVNLGPDQCVQDQRLRHCSRASVEAMLLLVEATLLLLVSVCRLRWLAIYHEYDNK